ncbi:hypothetical protein GCM10018952_29900 [Streptosporangium vulgare]
MTRPPREPATAARRHRVASRLRGFRTPVLRAPGGLLSIQETVRRDTLADPDASAATGGWSPTLVCTAAPHLALDKTVNANNHAVKRSPYYGLITPET